MNIQNKSYVFLSRVNDLFNIKSWPIDIKNKHSLFNRYIQTCQLLDNEELDLFLKLSRNYEVISLDKYQELLIELLKTAIDKFPPIKQSQILIYPIKTKEDDSLSIKSSDLLSYICKSIKMKYDDKLYSKTAIVIKNTYILKEHLKKIKNGNPLFLVDDFIGSGEYVSSVVDELISDGVPKSNIVVCSLFLCEDGEKRLKKQDISYVSNHIVKSILPTLKPSEIKLLKDMCNKTKPKEENIFGYNNSAALITLVRTPNNTIPLFWNNIEKNNAPFPRNK